jgi:diguanylate cyclase (GGDEF)-like protein
MMSTAPAGDDTEFRLLRYFSITSFVAIASAAILLGFLYREIAVNQLIKSVEDSNTIIAKTFASAFRADYSPLIDTAVGLSADELRTHPLVVKLNFSLLDVVQGLSVVKVKIYDLKARTIYSSELRQIGEDKSTDPGYVAARAGGVKSVLYYRESFHAFGRIIKNRDLLASYIPVWRSGSEAIEAVFELYSDVTPLLGNIERTQRYVVSGGVAVLILLYGILFGIVKRADGVIKRQVRERKHAEELIRHLANHDVLTGLPNRRLLEDRLSQALIQARRRRTRIALMLIDLDGFKAINDTLGHLAGDTVLQTVAKRLSGCVRQSDTVARQGGDEFVIILHDLMQTADSAKIADKIRHVVAEPMTISGQRLAVGASIGISVYPDDAGDGEGLLKIADGAMYSSKQTRKSANLGVQPTHAGERG